LIISRSKAKNAVILPIVAEAEEISAPNNTLSNNIPALRARMTPPISKQNTLTKHS